MNIFVVTLNEPNKKVVEKIKEIYPPPQFYEISPLSFLLATPEFPRDIALKIGLREENLIEDALGVVFKLNGAYSGYSYHELWDWIKQNEGQMG